MNETYQSIEIRVCNNGYWTLPSYACRQNIGQTLEGESVHVFESFEALTAWLKANLKEIKK
jgi:hypothetical protein